jgi:hypothetical protein
VKNAIDDDAMILQRIEALIQFENDLAAAAAEFSAAEDGTGRNGALAAIRAVQRFFVNVEIPLGLFGPLLALTLALEGLKDGRVVPLVAPSDTRKKPHSTEGEWIQRAWAAAVLQLKFQELSKENVQAPLQEASRWIKRQIHQWKIVAISKDAAQAVKSWRTELISRPKSDIAAQVYFFYTDPDRGWTSDNLLKLGPTVWGIQPAKYKKPPA